MKDALANLAKLPERCAAVMNGEVVTITRGAIRPSPLPLASTVVDSYNRNLGVTNAQVAAMIVGVTLGWNADGADPDTQTDAPHDFTKQPFTYTYDGRLNVVIQVEAYAEPLAAQHAQTYLRELACELDGECPGIVSIEPDTVIDFRESNDPAEA